jgi:hypothetical protein
MMLKHLSTTLLIVVLAVHGEGRCCLINATSRFQVLAIALAVAVLHAAPAR